MRYEVRIVGTDKSQIVHICQTRKEAEDYADARKVSHDCIHDLPDAPIAPAGKKTANNYALGNIEWTKKYQGVSGDRAFSVFITEHDNGNYWGGVFYVKSKTGSFDAQTMMLDFDLKSFVAKSEEGALGACQAWILDNLGKWLTFSLVSKT